MVTRQLQVKRRTRKVRRPKINVLPLCHATNYFLIGVVREISAPMSGKKNSENPLHSDLCHLLSFITHSNVRSHLAHLWVADGNIFPREVVELGVFGVTVSQPHGVIGVEP